MCCFYFVGGFLGGILYYGLWCRRGCIDALTMSEAKMEVLFLEGGQGRRGFGFFCGKILWIPTDFVGSCVGVCIFLLWPPGAGSHTESIGSWVVAVAFTWTVVNWELQCLWEASYSLTLLLMLIKSFYQATFGNFLLVSFVFCNQNYKYIILDLRDGKLFWESHCLVTFSYKGACRVRDRTFLGNGSLNGKGLGSADVRLQWVGG